MSYGYITRSTIGPRIESLLNKRRSSLPLEDDLREALNVCTLPEATGPLYLSLDDALDKASTIINTSSFWPAVSFTHELGGAGAEPELITSEPETMNNSTGLYNAWSEDFRDRVKRATSKLWISTGNTRSHQISHNLIYRAQSALSEWQSSQLDHLLQQAKDEGYVKQRDQFGLADEIDIRKEQFPGDRLYVFLGNSLGSFFSDMYGQGKIKWRGAFLVHYENRWDGTIGTHDSLVLAKSQVHTSQANEGGYVYQRAPRQWKYAVAVIHKYKIALDAYPGNNRKVIKDCRVRDLF